MTWLGFPTGRGAATWNRVRTWRAAVGVKLFRHDTGHIRLLALTLGGAFRRPRQRLYRRRVDFDTGRQRRADSGADGRRRRDPAAAGYQLRHGQAAA